ncbi:hypothetical protein ACA910_015560 [Epithemia clementina (nom. ined.)]
MTKLMTTSSSSSHLPLMVLSSSSQTSAPHEEVRHAPLRRSTTEEDEEDEMLRPAAEEAVDGDRILNDLGLPPQSSRRSRKTIQPTATSSTASASSTGNNRRGSSESDRHTYREFQEDEDDDEYEGVDYGDGDHDDDDEYDDDDVVGFDLSMLQQLPPLPPSRSATSGSQSSSHNRSHNPTRKSSSRKRTTSSTRPSKRQQQQQQEPPLFPLPMSTQNNILGEPIINDEQGGGGEDEEEVEQEFVYPYGHKYYPSDDQGEDETDEDSLRRNNAGSAGTTAMMASSPMAYLQQYTANLDQEETVRFCCQSSIFCFLGMALTVAVLLSVWNWATFDDDKVLDWITGRGPLSMDGFPNDNPTPIDGSGERNFGDDPLNQVIEVAGSTTCRQALQTPIFFPAPYSAYATVLDRTDDAGATTTASTTDTRVCQINAESPGVWYALRGRDARYNVTVAPYSSSSGDDTVGTATSTWNQIRVSVMRGSCADDGTFGSLFCLASHSSVPASAVPSSLSASNSARASSAGEADVSSSPPLLIAASVEFYGDPDVLYYIFVQGVAATDKGAFRLTVQRAWNLPTGTTTTSGPSTAEFDGSVVNGTFGISVALSADASIMAASAAFADNLNGPQAGHVRFFRRTLDSVTSQPHYVETSAGVLLGPNDTLQKNQSLFGFNIDLSDDGKTLAVLQSDALAIYQAIQQGATAALAWRGPTLYVETENLETHAAGSVSMSGNGNTVAWNVHIPQESRGYVQVFEREQIQNVGDGATTSTSSDVWKQKGQLLTLGTYASGNVYDKAVALSDNGNTLVMAGPDYTARLYDWHATSQTWVLRYNHVISDVSSVAITGNGNCVAAGLGGNQDTQVKVYCYRANDDEDDNGGGTVQQVGQTLTGSSTNFGHAVSLSRTGLLLAVGAPWYDGTALRRDSGRVFLYQYHPTPEQQWRLQGRLETLVASDLYGWSTALSADGSALVVGAPWHRGQVQTSSAGTSGGAAAASLFQAGMVQVANVYV